MVGGVLLMSATGARAADWGDNLSDWSDNLYLSADFGGVFQQDATYIQSALSGRPTATFNPGIRADINLGYNLNDSWAVELETGFMWNSMDNVGGRSLSSISQSVDMYSVPILANIIYQVPTKTSWVPYFGVGAGGVVGIYDLKSRGTDYSDTDFTFAYQAEAGLDYALSKNVSVGIAYKFLGALNQHWLLSPKLPFDTYNPVTLDGVYIHAVVVKFTWSF